MDQLYLEIEISTRDAVTTIYTSVSSFLALYTHRYISPKNVQVNFVNSKIEGGRIALRSSQLRKELTEQHITCREAASLPAIRDLKLPIYEKDGNTYIAGTCAVCRLVFDLFTFNLVKFLHFPTWQRADCPATQ